jgi:hypothetical protein
LLHEDRRARRRHHRIRLRAPGRGHRPPHRARYSGALQCSAVRSVYREHGQGNLTSKAAAPVLRLVNDPMRKYNWNVWVPWEMPG